MWILFSLLAAFTAAVSVTLTRVGVAKVSSAVAFAVQAVLILLVSWTVVLAQGRQTELQHVEARTWWYLVAAGVVTTLSSLFSFEALKLAGAGQAGVLDKVSIVFVVLLAWWFLKEKVTWQIALGAGLMVAGAILIAVGRQNAD